MNYNGISIGHGFLVGQIVALLGGLLLLALGGAILYTIAYWRQRALQLEGVIIGVRRRGPYFHNVYRYSLPAGELREATSVQGGVSLQGRETGRHVDIQVIPDKPGEAREAHAPVTWVLALALLVGGAWLTYFAVTEFKRSVFTWILVAAVLLYAGHRLWRWLGRLLPSVRPAASAVDTWSAIPVGTAETLGLRSQPQHSSQPQQARLQIKGLKSRRTGVIFCIAGCVILATAGLPARQLLQLRTGVRVTGTVTQLSSNTSNNNDASEFPVVQFITTDGTRTQFKDRTGAYPSPYKVGDSVKVLYQPGKPYTAMIDRGARNWEPIIALLILGAAFTILGLISLRGR